MKKLLHRLITGRLISQLGVWCLFFFMVFLVLNRLVVPNPNSLFHSMTTFDKENEGFALKVIYVIGVALFSGLLVMIFTNHVRNRINRIESGDVRYRFNKHVVVFGYDEMVIGVLLSRLSDKGTMPTNYVIVVEKDVKKIKEEIVGAIGSNIRGLYVLHGSRVSKKDLKALRVYNAKEIYLIGEGGENSEALDLQSLLLISSLEEEKKKYRKAKDTRVIKDIKEIRYKRCIYMYNPENGRFSFIENCLSLLPKDFLKNTFLKVIDVDELCINNILGDSDNYWPQSKIHKRGSDDVINWQSEKRVHLVIFGMNNVSKKFVKRTSNYTHFPNHYTKGINTLITIIDENIGDASFLIDEYNSYFNVCNYEIKSIKGNVVTTRACHKQIEHANYIDIDFEFIETEYGTPSLNELIKSWAVDKSQYLSLYSCIEDFNKGFNVSINFPDELYENKIPIWLYSKKNAHLSDLLSEKYQNIILWGNPCEKHPFSNWDLEQTSNICLAAKSGNLGIVSNDYNQKIYNYISFCSILHTSTVTYGNTAEETKALIITEYNRACVTSLFDGESKVFNIFMAKELKDKGYLQTEICNFENLPKEVRQYYNSLVTDVGLGIFQGKPIYCIIN